MAESGVSGYEFSSWFGLAVPRGTPAAVVQKLHEAASKAVHDKVVAERLSASLTEPVGAGPKEFSELIAREGQRWSSLIKQLGLKID